MLKGFCNLISFYIHSLSSIYPVVVIATTKTNESRSLSWFHCHNHESTGASFVDVNYGFCYLLSVLYRLGLGVGMRGGVGLGVGMRGGVGLGGVGGA